MTVCATCSRELQPGWKFCIYCGTPTGVPLTAAIEIVRAAAESEDVRAATQAAGGLRTGAIMIVTSPSVATSEPIDTAEPLEKPEPGEVLKIEDIPADEPGKPAAAIETIPVARVNMLAVLALVLGCLVSPLAAVFGHIALNQITRSGERGTAIAWVAIVLGYLALAALLVLGISYFVLNA